MADLERVVFYAGRYRFSSALAPSCGIGYGQVSTARHEPRLAGVWDSGGYGHLACRGVPTVLEVNRV